LVSSDHHELRAEGGRWEMIRISVEVRSGAGRFEVVAEAESIERALEIVANQNPGRVCEVKFPIDPETFFVEASVFPIGHLAA
jgi:hypothetical protein